MCALVLALLNSAWMVVCIMSLAGVAGPADDAAVACTGDDDMDFDIACGVKVLVHKYRSGAAVMLKECRTRRDGYGWLNRALHPKTAAS